MSIQQLILAQGSNPLITVDGADFAGYMSRGAGLTGAADSAKGILSFWLRPDSAASSYVILRSDVGGLAYINLTTAPSAADTFFFQQLSSSGGVQLVNQNTVTAMVVDTWYHILSSWDLTVPTSSLYLNDVDDKHESSATAAGTIDNTHTNWFFGASSTGTLQLNACIADFYYNQGEYLDFSLVANRRKFISASGKPVHLGLTGALPTGIAPIMYHHLDDAETATNFVTNDGTGGNFSIISGTFTTASTSPSG